jgi:serine phosphatase RsbU (regulator of sigma subunit)
LLNPLSQDEGKTRTLAEAAKGAASGVFLGIYDDALRRLEYVSCGHNPALLVRAPGVARG